MFRNQKDPYGSMKMLFDLAKSYMDEKTSSSLIAAYKIFSTLQENYPDKAYQGQLGVVKDQLDKLGLLDQVLKEENEKEKNKSHDQKKIGFTSSPNALKAKL